MPLKHVPQVLLLASLSWCVEPISAECAAPTLIPGVPWLITTFVERDGAVSYVYTPGVSFGPSGGGVVNSSITAGFRGYFWGVGFGNPAPGLGPDNGTFPALGPDLQWMYTYPDHPALVLTNWAASTDIDCCIEVQGQVGERCTAALLEDVDPTTGDSAFALLTAPDDPLSGDFYMGLPGGAPITLAPQPALIITGALFDGGATVVQISVQGPTSDALQAGLFLSDASRCHGPGAEDDDPLNGMVLGYRIMYQLVPRGSPPPQEPSVELWIPTDDVGAVGSEQTIAIACGMDSDVYLSYQLLFDSGFAARYVAPAATRVECGPNIADPRPRGRERPPVRQRAPSRRGPLGR